MPSLTCDDLPRDEVGRLLNVHCPGSLWQETLAQRFHDFDVGERLVYLNVGANKGYNIAEFLSTWTNRRISNKRWHSHVRDFGRSQHMLTLLRQHFLSCGVCKVCERPMSPADTVPNRTAEVHAFELLPANQQLLEHATRRAGLTDVVTIHRMAVSNVSGRTTFLTRARNVAGREDTKLCSGLSTYGGLRGERQRCQIPKADWKHGHAKFVPINVTTVDDFLDRKALRRAFIVSIDVEGFDALVLEGMRRSIASHRVRIFEFEYSRKGFWAHRYPRETRSLAKMLRGWLSSSGFSCFWQTRSGRLVPVLASCWERVLMSDPRAGGVTWSNVVCAREPGILAIFNARPVAATARDVLREQCDAAAQLRATKEARDGGSASGGEKERRVCGLLGRAARKFFGRRLS